MGAMPGILDRETSKVIAKGRIDNDSFVLRSLVDYSTKLYARCAASHGDEENVDLTPLVLFLHMIEMSDGVEVLTREVCDVPAVPLVRSAFEALLSLEYVCQDDYRSRSLAWLTSYAHRRIDLYETFDPSTDKGKTLKRKVQKDKWIKSIPEKFLIDSDSKSKPLRNLLKRPEFVEFEEKWNKLVGKKFWCRLCDTGDKKISSIDQLAERLDRGAQYEILYRRWAGICHAHDASSLLTLVAGTREGPLLRNPESEECCAQFAAEFLLRANELMILRFRCGEKEQFTAWYISEIRDKFRRMSALIDVPEMFKNPISPTIGEE